VQVHPSEYPRMLQHCSDLRHVAVQTRRGDHRARSKHTEPGCFGRRSSRCGTRWGSISPPRRTVLPVEGNSSLFLATVATLCPFLLPPIRRHRSVIRNCVSLSSPYPIWTYVRVPAYFFSSSFSLDHSVALLRSVYHHHCPAVSFPLLPYSKTLSLSSLFFFVFFPCETRQ